MLMHHKLDKRYVAMILDSVNQGIFTVNAEGVVTTFNLAAQRITGYSEEEAIGKRCRELLSSDLCETVCPMKQSFSTFEEIKDREVMIRKKNGEKIPISVTTSPLLTKGGKLLGGVEVFRDLSQIVELKKQLRDKYKFEDIVSKNAEMRRIFQLLPFIADSMSTILITGESGTGKELIARAIHNQSQRKANPFIAINCAAMPETLLESEMFGYEKGAFTDARRDKPGLIARAEGGTLFLDEVADLARALQVKLLRFLQEKEYEPLGGHESYKADVRVIAATNRNLRDMVRNGEFREDLYFRLNVMEIPLPPLRERSEDIPLLAEHFVKRFRNQTDRDIQGMTNDAVALLMHYTFPGNIRELENIIERAFIVCRGKMIDVVSLPQYIREMQPAASGFSPQNEMSAKAQPKRLIRAEAETIQETLKRNNGNKTRAAKELGIHRTTLIRKLKKMGAM